MNSEKVKEVKKALECCSNSWNCNSCDRNKEGNNRFQCSETLLQKVLILINELEKENAVKTNTITDLLKKQEFYEKKKLKQFAERLKEKSDFYRHGERITDMVTFGDIDETLKEFINE